MCPYDVRVLGWRVGSSAFACFLILALAAGCRSVDDAHAIHVKDGASRLSSLLRARGVSLSPDANRPRPLRDAWRAFKAFASVPVLGSELSDDPGADGLLVEYGIFGSTGSSGRTFQLSFARQLATRDGDLQQVHLDVRFGPGAFATIGRHIRARTCTDGEGCQARCVFSDKAALFGAPCAESPAGRVPTSVSAWSFDTGGSGTDEQRASWISFVEASAAFREAASELKPVRYEVWQESAE
jgi:hypothetical protein